MPLLVCNDFTVLEMGSRDFVVVQKTIFILFFLENKFKKCLEINWLIMRFQNRFFFQKTCFEKIF